MIPAVFVSAGKKVVFLTLALLVLFLSVSGVLERVVGRVTMIDRIYEEDHVFLKRSLTRGMEHFAVLSVVKGSLSMINDSAPFGIAIGKLVSPVAETVHVVWKLFGISLFSITFQMALLGFFRIVGIKIFVAGGAVLYLVSLGHVEPIKRSGLVFMVTGLVIFTLVPYSIYAGKILFEKGVLAADQDLSQDLAGFKKTVDEIKIFSLKNLRPKYARQTARKVGESLSRSMDILLGSIIRYFIRLITMFVITPVFFYGLLYAVLKKVFAAIGTPQMTLKLDRNIIQALRKV